MIKFCYYWGVAGVPWNNGNWWWSQCNPLIPPTPPFQMPPGIDATIAIQPWQAEEQWNPYRAGEFNKRKRLIKLICKVKGQIYEEEKEVGDMEISVDDIKMVVKAVAGIDLDVKLEE